MTRKEALEYVNNMWMSKETHDALETLIPEFGESEDERIRKDLVFLCNEWLKDVPTVPIEKGYINKILAWLEKQKEQKPISQEDFDKAKHEALWGEQKPAEWSEEDKEMLECVIMDVESAKKNYLKSTTEVVRQGAIIADKELAWLKSLRPQPKAELTLLDKNIINAAVAFVEQNNHFNCWGGIDKHTVIKALRSLKPSWKPSEEQVEALEDALTYIPEFYKPKSNLTSLLRDLKKQI